MSLARAVTKRLKRSDAPAKTSPLSQSKSMKFPALPIDRSAISSPVALISTTNMLSYNAPDISSLRLAASSTCSTHSADDSDHSTTRSRASSHGSRDTLTDASSISSSPTSAAPNHLSGFFAPGSKTPRRSQSSSNMQECVSLDEEATIPAIPERALSHSKRAHERLAKQRSLQNIVPRSSLNSVRSSREHRTSVDMFRANVGEDAHPFGKELEQLNEVAEEFGGVVRDAEVEADMAAIRDHGLATFCAADYLQEISSLVSNYLGHPRVPGPMAWI